MDDCRYSAENLPVETDDMTVKQARELAEERKRLIREQRDKHRAEEARLVALFKADLEAEHGIVGNPKADRLFEIAWEHGHSSGYGEVLLHYEELVELVK